MNIHFIQHEIFEAPGAYHSWALSRGHCISCSKIYEHEPLPERVDDIDLLIVMGGPQSPDTSIDECPHFNGAAEIEFIRKCHEKQKMIIGVCLGAQLLGEAFGAKYEHSPQKEIGTFPIILTKEGLADKNVKHLGATLTVGHWHGDMPGLSAESKILAFSEGCPRQIIAYSPYAYGFQCHLEFNEEIVKLLIAQENDLQLQSQTHPFIQSPQAILDFDYTVMNEQLYDFLDELSKKAGVDNK